MWHSRRCDSAVDIPRPLERPWTPPEVEDRPYARPNHFSVFGNSPSRYPRMAEQHWSNEANRVREQPSYYSPRTPSIISRPKLSSHHTEPLPYTPTRAYHFDGSFSPSRGMPRYPYTPDSSQILRRHTEIVSSPTPWDNYSDHSLSPVQDALSSCIAHFEELIQSQQPDEDQMEYIVRQFEAMATHLSTGEPQTKETDEQDFALSRHGSDIMHAEDYKDDLADAKSLYHQAYVTEVGNYVKSVQTCINELKKRLDEVKTLNSIQLDVIDDLRKQMKNVRQNMRKELSRSDGTEQGRQEEVFRITKVVDLDDKVDKWPTEDSNESNDPKHHDDSNREFGLDSCQTLVEDFPSSFSNISQEIQNEYTKLVRSAVYNLTADDNDDLLTTPQLTVAKRKRITVIRKPPPKPSFWASVGEALDRVAEVLWED
ncbi:uncharacterized protein yc1106_08305 [Curvularia clavata]|uniref:Uncharacterized protein n=1 Tax=Curvularia clavata TaxID=95742 RepID=A0A9Q8ZF91_CURCL|nr:uncharacterized protein yc1106_08305 [Curvularia clavata]